MRLDLPWTALHHALAQVDPLPVSGRVTGLVGLLLTAAGPAASVGELCLLQGPAGQELPAEVVGFRDGKTLLMPLGDPEGVEPGWTVRATGGPLRTPVGDALLGRVLDGLGRPADGLGPLPPPRRPVTGPPPAPLDRRPITTPLSLGVRALDGLLTCGRGQRLGIFAGSGVGKSTLLGMIARNAAADCNVIALVGERGREVREFLERDLGAEGLQRSVVVVATSDQPALVRIKAALVATAIAEEFRDQGKEVLLMMDSCTRLAHAQREVGLAVGEPPATRGYTPSVFALLPRVLERAGNGARGGITAIYTVLVDGDDLDEPVADTVRGILDGHVVLSRRLAQQGQFPAVDVLASVSRAMPAVTEPAHRELARRFRAALAIYRENEDLISVGAYQSGGNPALDDALARLPQMQAFLKQELEERSDLALAVGALERLFGGEGR